MRLNGNIHADEPGVARLSKRCLLQCFCVLNSHGKKSDHPFARSTQVEPMMQCLSMFRKLVHVLRIEDTQEASKALSGNGEDPG